MTGARPGPEVMALHNALRPLHLQMRIHVNELRGWLPMFHIWALQWLLNGVLQWYGPWKVPSWIQPLSAMAAALACIGILLAGGLTLTERMTPSLRMVSLYAAVPFGIAAGSLMLMEYTHAVNPFFMDLTRALLLSFFFSCLGLLLGLELMLLGVWLFALTAVTCTSYLGFAPMVLNVMGGLSLAVCGTVLQVWSRRPMAATEPQTPQ